MKRKLLAAALTVIMILSLLPAAAFAAALPGTSEDVITLTDGTYELSDDTSLSKPIEVTGTVTLDLSGNTLSPVEGYQEDYLIKIKEGGNLTLIDSEETGKITTDNKNGIRGISNNGTFTMKSGKIEVHSYAIENVVTKISYESNQPVICNITGGELTASYAWTVLFMGAGMAGQTSNSYESINTGEDGSVRNDLM